LSSWIKTTSRDSRWRRIFDKSFSKGFALSVAGDWASSDWRGSVAMEMGTGHFVVTKNKVADGRWHHVVATFDGTSEVIYLDGQAAGWKTWPQPGRAGPTDYNLVIGCNRSDFDKSDNDLGVSFRGLIDEPMMWNRALSEKEVVFLYQSQQ
jgi:hypothetical protein